MGNSDPGLIDALDQLGAEISDFLKNRAATDFSTSLAKASRESFHHNGWFTLENINIALKGIANWLSGENLASWLGTFGGREFSGNSKNIGIVMAGNIPLVGFHDLLSTLLTGHRALIKMSSADRILLPVLIEELNRIIPGISSNVVFMDRLSGFDAVIATGSNNTARYFKYYFGKYPHIIRRNKNSVAVLVGDETREELELLAADIFHFFGLGCRSVAKILVPEDFDLNRIFESVLGFSEVINHHKYANNYEYHKVIYLLNQVDIIENGFLIMKRDDSLFSPVSLLFYEEYKDETDLKRKLESAGEDIQCIVSRHKSVEKAVAFGQSQFPELKDYADDVNTVDFLLNL